MMTSKQETPLDLTPQEIKTATDGELLHAGSLLSPLSCFVSDSRKAVAGCAFLCIPGAKVDGHDFAPQAAQNGATLVLGDNAAKLSALAASFPRLSFIHVKDSLRALQALAAFYRGKFRIPVVGLTGSSGKTTTKDLIASILNPSGAPERALITEGTLNNHWGVPQMVLRLRGQHKAAVFEMGMSDFGEIRALSAIAQPNIGYITAIGPAHLEKLGSVEGVLKAKRELFDWIERNAPEGTLLFNLDDPLLAELHSELRPATKAKMLTLSIRSKADFHLVRGEILGESERFGWRYEFHAPSGAIEGILPLPGRHNLANALAAAALALITGASGKHAIQSGLAHPRISALRSDVFRAPSGAIIYDDSYNANPTSVAALFETAKSICEAKAGRFQHVLAAVGDMLELGPQANELHRAMGKKAADCGVTRMFALGHHAEHWLEGFKKTGRAFSKHETLAAELQAEIARMPEKTLVLIKGSRGAKMDLIVNQLRG